MDPESLFCWTFIDLDACVRSSWHYHQLRIAGIVRLLIMDGDPLAHQVNRAHRLKLEFSHGRNVSQSSPDAAADAMHDGVPFAYATLEPAKLDSSAPPPTQSNLPEWLRVEALRVAGRVLTVHEFIQAMAYLEGLTHAGRPSTDEEKQFLTVRRNEARRIDNMSKLDLDLLKQIGRVTHTGLLPLFLLAKRTRDAKEFRYPVFTYEAPAS